MSSRGDAEGVPGESRILPQILSVCTRNIRGNIRDYIYISNITIFEVIFEIRDYNLEYYLESRISNISGTHWKVRTVALAASLELRCALCSNKTVLRLDFCRCLNVKLSAIG